MSGERVPAGGTKRPDTAPRRIPALEWVIAALGALLVAGAIGWLVHHALERDETPPDVRIVALRVVDLETGFLVQFEAWNQGRQPAAELVIEGELTGPEGTLETGETTLDYLAPRSRRQGGLFFARDPRVFELHLRAKGYAEP